MPPTSSSPPPPLSSLNWVSTKSCWSRIFWGEGDLPEWEQLIINGSEGQGSEVSPTCFSSLCSFIRFYFILSILTISLLKREQRFLLSHQATKNCMNLWLIPGNSSAVWWLCSFHGWRLFRQKKSKCKILAISIAIEREILLRCFVCYYFLISLLFGITLYFLSLKKFFLCEILHISLCLHHAESPGKTPQKRCCLHLGVSIWAGFCWKDWQPFEVLLIHWVVLFPENVESPELTHGGHCRYGLEDPFWGSGKLVVPTLTQTQSLLLLGRDCRLCQIQSNSLVVYFPWCGLHTT